MYELTTTQTKEDYIVFNRYHAKASDLVKKAIFIGRIIGPVIFTGMGYLMGRLDEPYFIGLIVVLSVLWVRYIDRYMWYTIDRRISKMSEESSNGDSFSTKITTVNDDGITETTNSASTFYRWSGVMILIEHNEAIYIYISTVQAIIIQNRAFTDKAEQERFVEYCKGKI